MQPILNISIKPADNGFVIGYERASESLNSRTYEETFIIAATVSEVVEQVTGLIS